MSLNFKVLQQAISLHFTVVRYITTMSCTFTNLCVCICIVLYGNPTEFKILHNARNLILQCETYNYYNVNEVLVVPVISYSLPTLHVLFYMLDLCSPGIWPTSLQKQCCCSDSSDTAYAFLHVFHLCTWKSRFVSIPLSSASGHYFLPKICLSSKDTCHGCNLGFQDLHLLGQRKSPRRALLFIVLDGSLFAEHSGARCFCR